MSTVTGRQAEAAVAEFLTKQGHKVLSQNWRTRWCEIDLITRKSNTVYFVEVKYRRNAYHGSGLEYITPAKLRQMRFAAEMWLVKNNQSNLNYRLAAAAVSGEPARVDSWLDEL